MQADHLIDLQSKRKLLSNFAHLLLFSNNSVEVNLLEIEEKEKFGFESITTEGSETDSPAGRIAGELQQKTFRIFQRIR